MTLAFLAGSFPVLAADCERLYREHLETDLELSYEQFDQTLGQGFRPLSAAGCNAQAADLIEAWIAHHDGGPRSLTWHVAQLRAMDGDYERAVASARASLAETEDFGVRPLRWNDYVLATIAFLEKDREARVRHRDRVAEGVEDHAGNAMNLRLLDSLLRNFDESYVYALKHME